MSAIMCIRLSACILKYIYIYQTVRTAKGYRDKSINSLEKKRKRDELGMCMPFHSRYPHFKREQSRAYKKM